MSHINELLSYALEHKIIKQRDVIFMNNQLNNYLNIKDVESFEQVSILNSIDVILSNVVESNFSDLSSNQKEQHKSALIGLLMPAPSYLEQQYYSYDNIKESTDFFYQYNKDVNYIKVDALAKNIHKKHDTKYGELDITINLSKPEKDPKDIAQALSNTEVSNYPICPLCIENEGYFGNNKAADRSNHRMIGLKLNNENYFFQYSPYSYFNEHCILIKEEHQPMAINENTFAKLFSFVDLYPHYFIGSNADLPIVGGSLLSHDHFQAGNYIFAINKAKMTYQKDFTDYSIGILNWPVSSIKLMSKNKDVLLSKIMDVLT